MSGVGRYVKFTAQPGRGPELADLLLRAADSLHGVPGGKGILDSKPAGSWPAMDKAVSTAGG